MQIQASPGVVVGLVSVDPYNLAQTLRVPCCIDLVVVWLVLIVVCV